jgi:hypothetical protein
MISCEINSKTEYVIDFDISSPNPRWVHYEDTKILLAINIDTNHIFWKSSIDGNLGEGNHILCFLSPGLHTLSVEVYDVTKSIEINIVSRNNVIDIENKTLVNYSPLETYLSIGNHAPYILTLNGTINGIFAGQNEMKSKTRLAINFSSQGNSPFRDIRIVEPRINEDITESIINKKLRLRNNNLTLGESRRFFIVNTISQFSDPHELDASLFYISDNLTVWIPSDSTFIENALNICIQKVEQIILPRLKILFGTAADIDNDGRLAILVTPTINDEKVAVGFFNPANFYNRNIDTNSDIYNPASNEMDIIYIAAPDESSNTSYSVESIIATIAHELTHAITYTRKTWQRQIDGETNAVREELFLDEGLSHLSENLCGFGKSGGNIKFLQKYFDDTASYSFCKSNRFGQEDSAGMRGAITMFLSWLYWEMGGMEYDKFEPGKLIDCGGITFLKKIVDSTDTGWENIGKAVGIPTDKLFEEMVSQINRNRLNNLDYHYKIDPITNEPVEFFINMKNAEDYDYVIGLPKEYDLISPTNIVKWTFMLFPIFTRETKGILNINSQNQDGTAFFITRIN